MLAFSVAVGGVSLLSSKWWTGNRPNKSLEWTPGFCPAAAQLPGVRKTLPTDPVVRWSRVRDHREREGKG